MILKLHTLEEVAEQFRVSRRTMQDLIKRYPYYRSIGRRKIFTEADIVQLYGVLECPSNSSKDTAHHTGISAAPSEGSLWTKAQVLLTASNPKLKSRREWEITQGAVFGRRATATFLEAAVSYMEQGGESRFLEPIIKALGSKLLATIDQAIIDTLAHALYPRAKASTRNRQCYTPISAVLKHAHARKLCDRFDIERPPESPGRVRWITPGDANSLVATCSVHLRPLVVFLLYTGSRLGEAVYLDWSAVDLSRAHVSFLDTKSGEPRGVPLHPRIIAALGNLSHRTGSVFRRPDGSPYARKADGGGQIKTAFNGACRRAGIENFHPHDCRHTWATWHYTANRDLGALMRLGGWKSERMVLRYAHVNTGELAASINALPWGDSGETNFETLKTGENGRS